GRGSSNTPKYLNHNFRKCHGIRTLSKDSVGISGTIKPIVASEARINVAEDKFEAVDPLARVSREKGFVLFDEDNIELIPAEGDGLPLDPLAIEAQPAAEERADEKPDEDFIELDGLDKTHDPVRLYLREMGSVPLLNRDGEIGIARRIERGQNKVRRI